jgi:hypothetical protein
VNGQLFALLTNDVDGISLVTLGRAITRARRRDAVTIQRSFVRSHGGRFMPVQRTARIRLL